MALVGSTVKLKAEFKDFDGNYFDPEEVLLNFYDNMRRQIGETIIIESKHNVDVGIYEYQYVVPKGVGSLTFEFIGMLEGNPSIGRGIMVRTWLKD